MSEASKHTVPLHLNRSVTPAYLRSLMPEQNRNQNLAITHFYNKFKKTASELARNGEYHAFLEVPSFDAGLASYNQEYVYAEVKELLAKDGFRLRDDNPEAFRCDFAWAEEQSDPSVSEYALARSMDPLQSSEPAAGYNYRFLQNMAAYWPPPPELMHAQMAGGSAPGFYPTPWPYSVESPFNYGAPGMPPGHGGYGPYYAHPEQIPMPTPEQQRVMAASRQGPPAISQSSGRGGQGAQGGQVRGRVSSQSKSRSVTPQRESEAQITEQSVDEK